MLLHKRIIFLIAGVFLVGCSSTGEKHTSKELFDILNRADAAYSEGNWLEAEMFYQQLIQKVPDDAYAWLRVGNARLQTGKINGAISAYLASINHDPNQSKPYYNLSTAYMIQAQRALETAKQKMQSHDPGLAYVEQRIQDIRTLSTTKNKPNPSESTSQGNSNRYLRFVMPSN